MRKHPEFSLNDPKFQKVFYLQEPKKLSRMFDLINKKPFAHLPLICLSIVTVCGWGCEGEETEDPDLLYEFADLAQEEVEVNTPLVLNSSITNEEAVCDNCSTLAASENDRSIRVEYRADENSPWVDAQVVDQNGDVVYELVKPVPEIKPGKKFQKTEGFVFTSPGIYRYKLLADRSDIVPERIETNNDATSADGDVRSAASSDHKFRLVVRVVDPKGKSLPVYGGPPAPVRYLE